MHPTDLGADGYQHPIVIWGNGADTSPLEHYEQVLTHLASWGYVVVAPNQRNVLASHGVEAGEWAVAQDTNPQSVFFGKLDTESVAALGHSRGSRFASDIWQDSPGLLTTAIGFSLTDRMWWEGTLMDQALCALLGICPDPNEPDWSEVESLFLIAGTNERMCLNLFAFLRICGDDLGIPLRFVSEGEQKYFFDQVDGPAARAAVVGGDHNVVGETISLGYATAWLKYMLEDDQFARQAFVGNSAQINDDSAWTWREQKNLP